MIKLPIKLLFSLSDGLLDIQTYEDYLLCRYSSITLLIDLLDFSTKTMWYGENSLCTTVWSLEDLTHNNYVSNKVLTFYWDELKGNQVSIKLIDKDKVTNEGINYKEEESRINTVLKLINSPIEECGYCKMFGSKGLRMVLLSNEYVWTCGWYESLNHIIFVSKSQPMCKESNLWMEEVILIDTLCSPERIIKSLPAYYSMTYFLGGTGVSLYVSEIIDTFYRIKETIDEFQGQLVTKSTDLKFNSKKCNWKRFITQLRDGMSVQELSDYSRLKLVLAKK